MDAGIGDAPLNPIEPDGLIRKAGLRVTRPRVQVLELMHRIGGHRSADEVLALLAEAGTRLPRASVYNVLRDLAGAGLLRCAEAGPGRALYEVSSHDHHHFVCRSCGFIQDVHPRSEPAPDPVAAIPGAVIEDAQIIYRGLCPDCR